MQTVQHASHTPGPMSLPLHRGHSSVASRTALSKLTGGLRRLTDISRSLVERTRGDVTLSLRQERLEQNLRSAEERFSKTSNDDHNN